MLGKQGVTITTSVKLCTCGFTHQIFGAVAGELTNLINFF